MLVQKICLLIHILNLQNFDKKDRRLLLHTHPEPCTGLSTLCFSEGRPAEPPLLFLKKKEKKMEKNGGKKEKNEENGEKKEKRKKKRGGGELDFSKSRGARISFTQPCPAHLGGFYFCIFTGFHAIFNVTSNNSINSILYQQKNQIKYS